MTSFVFGVLGVAVITLFVPGSRSERAVAAREQSEVRAEPSPAAVATSGPTKAAFKLLRTRSFGTVTAFAALLAMCTVSDGFIYLLLQQRTNTAASFIPLFYVGTACFYMLSRFPPAHSPIASGTALCCSVDMQCSLSCTSFCSQPPTRDGRLPSAALP